MDNVVALANQIGEIYTSTKEYKRYMELYDKLKTDEELMQALVHYRTTKVNHFVNYTTQGLENTELNQEILNLYLNLIENKDMKEMLLLEEELMKTLTRIYRAIGDKCVLNIEVDR